MSAGGLNNKRYDYIDVAKAIGMLTIMWGHIALGKSVTFVYSFHIPLYFFLSGIVFVPERYPSFSLFVKRRIKTLIVPYIIYSFVTWAIWGLYSLATHAMVESYWMPLLQTFIAQGSEGYLVHNVPLWFVSCLFVVEVLYYWIAKLPAIWNIVVCICLAASSFVMVNYCTFFDFSKLPWSIEVAMAALIFYSIGNLLVRHIGHEGLIGIVREYKLPSLCIMFALFLIVYWGGLKNGTVSMGHASIGNPFLFYPIAFVGISAIMILSLLMSIWLRATRMGNCIKWFGQNSFIAMAIHNPIKGFVIVMLASLLGMGKLTLMRNTMTAMLAIIITLAVTVLIMLIILEAKKRKAIK